jgi:hypothetical protein
MVIKLSSLNHTQKKRKFHQNSSNSHFYFHLKNFFVSPTRFFFLRIFFEFSRSFLWMCVWKKNWENCVFVWVRENPQTPSKKSEKIRKTKFSSTRHSVLFFWVFSKHGKKRKTKVKNNFSWVHSKKGRGRKIGLKFMRFFTDSSSRFSHKPRKVFAKFVHRK